MTAIGGIPTTYRRAALRSRVEARWASFFSLIGWKWTYEPLDTTGYIPDFLIHGKRPLFVEVGNCILQDDFVAKSAKPDAAAAELRHDILVVGVNVIADIPGDGVVAGWLGEYQEGTDEAGVEHAAYAWGPALWYGCTECREYGVVHEWSSWALRPCGHYDGDHFLSPLDPFHLTALWNHAGSTVQWKPPAHRR